jgi:hypothetical protein
MLIDDISPPSTSSPLFLLSSHMSIFLSLSILSFSLTLSLSLALPAGLFYGQLGEM